MLAIAGRRDRDANTAGADRIGGGGAKGGPGSSLPGQFHRLVRAEALHSDEHARADRPLNRSADQARVDGEGCCYLLPLEAPTAITLWLPLVASGIVIVAAALPLEEAVVDARGVVEVLSQ